MVKTEDGERIAKEKNIMFFETSVITKENLDKVFECAGWTLLKKGFKI